MGNVGRLNYVICLIAAMCLPWLWGAGGARIRCCDFPGINLEKLVNVNV